MSLLKSLVAFGRFRLSSFITEKVGVVFSNGITWGVSNYLAIIYYIIKTINCEILKIIGFAIKTRESHIVVR